MAKARMLHKKISVASQVNSLPLPARLLFTWMIAHADDEGRLKGDAEYIKAMVIPMTKWSFKRIRSYLKEMKTAGLIYHWQKNNEWFIEFVKWERYQSIRKDRFIPSDFPSFRNDKDNQQSTNSQPDDNQETPQSNISEYNPIEFNKSESNEIQPIADKKLIITNPKRFEPQTEGEVAAKEAWDQLETYNPLAFQTTYLKAYKRGLPSNLFYQFTSEIKQDPNIKNRGAVFNKKVEEYFEKEAKDD